jgi:general stress protein 26
MRGLSAVAQRAKAEATSGFWLAPIPGHRAPRHSLFLPFAELVARPKQVFARNFRMPPREEPRRRRAVTTPAAMEWNMTNDNARDVERAWELMKKIGFAMLVTRDGDELRARPMSAYLERESNTIYFLTDARRHKDEEITRNPGINLSFADASAQKYVSLTGTALVSNDRAKIKELFSTPAKAWWESADDPNIRVLKVTPDDAEYWDSPGTIVSYVKMAAAAVTGTRPDIGENRKISM